MTHIGDGVSGRPDPDDPDGLRDAVAIVTGAGARADGIGNGRAAAILLARAGATVVAVDRRPESAERTVEMIAAEGGSGVAVEADVTDMDHCARVVATAMDRFGRLDVLDNNVGIGGAGSVVDVDPEDWDRVLDVNLRSMFLMSKHAIPAMRATTRETGRPGGAIVNVSSISALRPRGLTAYSTSKGAVIALTKAMAVDHGPEGIRVNCVAPGPVFTPMVERGGMDGRLRDGRRRASVLGIEGTGWDVGNAVLFLASNRSRYVTGQTLVVDGGTTLRGPDRESGP